MRVKNLAILAVALALIGCRSTDPAVSFDAAGNARVSGKPSVAYLRVPKALRAADAFGGGLGASFDEGGEAMTVRASTPDGRKFTIHFRQDGSDASRVGIVWEGQPDDELGRKILAGLARD